MKIILSLFAVFLSFRQASALPMEGGALEARIPRDPCVSSNYTTAFLRAYDAEGKDHFYTTNVVEMEAAVEHHVYASEGDAAYVFTSQETSTLPLYRAYDATIVDHFYTTSASDRDGAVEHGYVDEGIAAYVYATQVCGTVPLFRVYSTEATDHFYTTSVSERNNAITNLGYVDEGTAAYVFPVPTS